MVIPMTIQIQEKEDRRKMSVANRYLECSYCGHLNELDATQCKHCGGSLKQAKTLHIERQIKTQSVGWKTGVTFLLLIASLVILADPFDIVPMPFFDALALVVIFAAIWVVVMLLDYRRERYEEVRKYE
jgi:hypothetical protein